MSQFIPRDEFLYALYGGSMRTSDDFLFRVSALTSGDFLFKIYVYYLNTH
jgi:hypothetical protein